MTLEPVTARSLPRAELEPVRLLLARAAGLAFDQGRSDALAYSVAERMRETGVPTLPAYVALLEGGGAELQALLDEATVQETHFFRNPPQVRALRDHVLPELLEAARGRRRLRVWSAGCSTGEEPYTVAMLLRDAMRTQPDLAGWDLEVLATDVSQRALAAAREGRYGLRALQMAEEGDVARHLEASGDGTYVVRREVRELVRFAHHNLVADPVPYPDPESVDLVLCRNVTIYFARETTRALMGRFHETLRDGGYLLLGHSETLWQVSEEFRLVSLGSGDSAAFVYRRSDPAAPERRRVLPDRRTADEGPPVVVRERRRRPDRRQDAGPAGAATAAAPAPVDVSGLADVARAALAAGRYADAAVAAGTLAQGAPLRPEGHYLRGVAAVSLGRDVEALVDLRRAAYLAPGDGLAHFLLAGVLARLGDAAAAAREYSAAAATLGPEHAGASELGGRAVPDLVALCHRLAARLARGQT